MSKLIAAIAALVTFAILAAALLQFMPDPVDDSDYLVAGSIATLVALLVLLLGLAFSRVQGQDVFFKKRLKQPKQD